MALHRVTQDCEVGVGVFAGSSCCGVSKWSLRRMKEASGGRESENEVKAIQKKEKVEER